MSRIPMEENVMSDKDLRARMAALPDRKDRVTHPAVKEWRKFREIESASPVVPPDRKDPVPCCKANEHEWVDVCATCGVRSPFPPVPVVPVGEPGPCDYFARLAEGLTPDEAWRAGHRQGFEDAQADVNRPPAGVQDELRERAQQAVFEFMESLPGGESRWDVAGRIVDLVVSSVLPSVERDGLDALAKRFVTGQTVVWGEGLRQRGQVRGFAWTIPDAPGEPDRPALVVEGWSGRTAHVLPDELTAVQEREQA